MKKEDEGKCLCGATGLKTKSMDNTIGACHCSMCVKWKGGPLLAIDCGTDVELVVELDVELNVEFDVKLDVGVSVEVDAEDRWSWGGALLPLFRVLLRRGYPFLSLIGRRFCLLASSWLCTFFSRILAAAATCCRTPHRLRRSIPALPP